MASSDRFTAATLTPQHLLYNRNALFTGGLRPHYYCLPVLKREEHRLALCAAVASGSTKFFLGTDSAPAAQLKGGLGLRRRLLHRAVGAGLYAGLLRAARCPRQAGSLCVLHGPDFYGLPRNTGTVTLKREPWTLPAAVAFGDASSSLRGGETLNWKLQ